MHSGLQEQALHRMKNKEQTPMTERTLPLITFYQGWETYQHSLVEIIAPLSPNNWHCLPRRTNGLSRNWPGRSSATGSGGFRCGWVREVPISPSRALGPPE